MLQLFVKSWPMTLQRKYIYLAALIMALAVVMLTNSVSADWNHSGLATHVTADFNQTNLETHDLGSWEFQTRQSQTYYDHNTVDIELGHTYLYANVINGCLWLRSGVVTYGDTEFDGPYGQNLLPELCDPDDETYTYSLWVGNTYEHGSFGGVLVDTKLYTDQNGNGLELGWEVGYLDDVTIDEDCTGGC